MEFASKHHKETYPCLLGHLRAEGKLVYHQHLLPNVWFHTAK